jgi:hypothetical protein
MYLDTRDYVSLVNTYQEVYMSQPDASHCLHKCIYLSIGFVTRTVRFQNMAKRLYDCIPGIHYILPIFYSIDIHIISLDILLYIWYALSVAI